MSFRIPRRDIELRFVTKFGENRPLRSCQKVLWITTQKRTSAPRDLSQPPFCPKWADHGNSLNVLTPWHVHVYRIWPGSAVCCRTYYGKIDNYNIGFQPTNIFTATTTWVRWKKIFKGNWSQLTINVVTIYGSFPLQLKSLPIYLETRREDAWRHESITKAVC